MSLRPPPSPFDPEIEELPTGTALYRVYSNSRRATDFNAGIGAPTRFGFFGDPTVPVMYAAATEVTAVCESLLHDVPVEGGLLIYDDYRSKVMGRLTTTRPLRLARLHGTGLRRVHAAADDISVPGASAYAETVRWAEAAHDAGLDGLVWMSNRCNDTRSYVFFGDRCSAALEHDTTFGRIFATGLDQFWLIDICAPLHVEVLIAP